MPIVILVMIIISIVNYVVHVHVQCHFDDDEDDDGDGGGCGRQLCSASHHTHFFERPLLDTSTKAPKLPKSSLSRCCHHISYLLR